MTETVRTLQISDFSRPAINCTTPLNGKDLCFRKPHLSDPKASDREMNRSNRARAALGEAEE